MKMSNILPTIIIAGPVLISGLIVIISALHYAILHYY